MVGTIPMTGIGIPSGADAVLAITRIDVNTIGATLQKAGREVMQAKLTVSDDGKVLTIRRTGTTNAVLVFDRMQVPPRGLMQRCAPDGRHRHRCGWG